MKLGFNKMRYTYKKLYRKQKKNRYESLYEVYMIFLKFVNSKENYCIDIELDILKEIVRSYFIDIIRYKETIHKKNVKIKYISEKKFKNMHYRKISKKRSAFFAAKWILIYKPIISTNGKPLSYNSNKYIQDINENYALICVCFILDIRLEDLGANGIEEIIYNFKFRELKEEKFFAMFSRDKIC